MSLAGNANVAKMNCLQLVMSLLSVVEKPDNWYCLQTSLMRKSVAGPCCQKMRLQVEHIADLQVNIT